MRDFALQQQNIDAKILLQVHDELVLEVRDDQVEMVSGLLKNIMEHITQTNVKMVVETGSGATWDAAH